MNGTTGVHEVASLLLVHRGYRGLGGRRAYADKALRVGSVFGALAILAGCGSSSGSVGLPAESSITHSSPAATASAVASMPGMSDMGAPSASASASPAS